METAWLIVTETETVSELLPVSASARVLRNAAPASNINVASAAM
jgi:hypothetical protein